MARGGFGRASKFVINKKTEAKNKMLKGLIEGRIVHYVIGVTDVPAEFKHIVGQHRAAVIVNSWPSLGREDGYSNLRVILDGSNDCGASEFAKNHGIIWATSRINDEDKKLPGTWHWIEMTPTAAEIKEPELTPKMRATVESILRDIVKASALK